MILRKAIFIFAADEIDNQDTAQDGNHYGNQQVEYGCPIWTAARYVGVCDVWEGNLDQGGQVIFEVHCVVSS